MICSCCQLQISDESKNCPFCGARIIRGYEICSKCNSPLTGNSKFCGKCGTPVQTNTSASYANTVYSSYQQMTMEECIGELNRMCEYFEQVDSVYREYDACDRHIKENSAPVLNFISHTIKPIWFICLGAAFFVLASFLQKENSLSAVIGWYIVGGIIILATLFYISLFLVDMIIALKNRRRQASRQAELAIELTKHYENYGYCIVGQEYTNPRILAMIKENMITGRSYTIQNAVDLLYIDNQKKEKSAVKFLEITKQRQNKYGAKTAAAFIPANFFD